MQTVANLSTKTVTDMLSAASIAPLSETNISTKDRLLAALQALPPKDSTPKDPAIAALLQSLNASTKFRQRANGNRRARRSIRVKRMYPKGYLRKQKHAKGFGWKLTQTTDHPNHPQHPHHPHHPNCPDNSKVLRSHAAQTAIDRYTNAASLGDALQPTFTQIASTLPTGSAPADLSMGWDGTLWTIDQQGAPHIYDPINNEWNVHGEGIDAAAAIGETLYLFRSNQYVTVNVSTQQTSAPLPITSIATNPNNPLPRSFQLGITGAAAVGNTLYLFHGGRYWPVDGSQKPRNLTDIHGWPTSAANWADGVIDTVSVSTNLVHIEQIELQRGDQSLFLEFTGQGFQVVGSPTSIPPQQQAISAGAVATVGQNLIYFYYSGVQVVQVGGTNDSPQYLPTLHQNWPATWNPVLSHAPSGRMGNLWVATKDGDFVHHNGESWSLALPDANATSVSVGNDNSVWMAHHSAKASFPGVYTVGDPGDGIPNVFDLNGAEDRSFAFDCDGSGKQDHLVFYRTGNGTAGTGKIAIVKNNGDGSFTQVYPAANTSTSAIGGYSFDEQGNPLSGQPGNLGFAFDYDGTGNLDHLVFYRPGTAEAISILKNQGGTFTQVYPQSGGETGIGDYPLSNPADRIFAYDCDGSGKQNHLVFYRTGTGTADTGKIAIFKSNGDGTFTEVYSLQNQIGGYNFDNLENSPSGQLSNLGFAYDYDGTGKLDHLVFYRPGAGAISILKNNNGSFTAVYQQPGSGNGIGDFDLSDPNDKGFAFDYKGTGKQNYLVFYSPGRGKISILQNFNGNFINVYPQGQQPGGIGNYDLASSADLSFSFDATGSGHQNGLVFYRPGTGAIFILKTELNCDPSFPPVYAQGDPGQGIGLYDIKSDRDLSFAFDYDSSGKLDHLVFYRPGTRTIFIIKNNQDGSFTPVYATTTDGIGGFDLGQPQDRGFAFDYDGSGKLDHLVFYRPGTGTIFIIGRDPQDKQKFKDFYATTTSGIGGYDLLSPADRGFAFDYKGKGKLNYLVFYRPGTGTIFIIGRDPQDNQKFKDFYATTTNGIGGYNLLSPADLGFAFDGGSDGTLNHLVFYRPGTGAIFIIKSNGDGTFETPYHQGDPGNGIGGFSLLSSADRGFAFDYDGSGKLDHLVFYRPGRGDIFIIKHQGDTFTSVYAQGDPGNGIGGYNLLSPADLGFAFDYNGSGKQDHLVFYRPGAGAIFILKTELYTPILRSWVEGSLTEYSQPSSVISQVSVGDASKVWVRDLQNNVLQYDSQNQQYNLNAQVGQAPHIGANNDGTLWHCNYTPDANRFVSEATAPSQPLSVNPAVTKVQRVATTGFGSSHCLAQHSDGTQGIYRYDSPYVFKTSESYELAPGSIATGLGKVYVLSQQLTGGGSTYRWSGQIVALDQHTGEEIASSPMVVDSIYRYNNPVLDPLRGLIYVTTQTTEGHTGGQLLVFDAQTLTQKWSYATTHGITTSPALDGNRLCFGDGAGTIYMFDVSTFSTAAPSSRWTYQLKGSFAFNHVTPAIVGNRVYVGYITTDNLCSIFLEILNATSGEASSPTPLELSSGNSNDGVIGANASVVVSALGSADADIEVYVPDIAGVFIVKPFTTSPQILMYSLTGTQLTTALTYDDGSRVGQTSAPVPSEQRLWFGDSKGQLWCIEWNWNATQPQLAVTATNGTPLQVYQNATIRSQPTLYKDSKGGLNVFFGLAALSSSNVTEVTNLLIYAPDATTYSILPTGVTSLGALSRLSLADNGVLYAGGSYSLNDPSQVLQVFGIRVDMLVQGLRDFIIESQMMQDPEEPPEGVAPITNGIPNSVNRYQTHLTVVDNKKSPRAKEPLKIWADKPNTQITLGSFSGTPNGPNGALNSKTNTYTCTIGPDDGDFVSVSAGVDGAITIVSDATDMYATPLRVWASFMNSYERIVVNPDQEFHQRVTTAHADANNNDPTKVNLATTTNYKGTPLFSSAEVTAGQPSQTATAVGQMKQGLNLGGTNTSTRLSFSRLMQGSRLVPHSPEGEQLAATSQAYTAYTDLHGMGYFATNVPSQRPVTPVQSVGFIYNSHYDPKIPITIGTTAKIDLVTHTEALGEIDTWTGTPWQPSDGGAERMLQGRRLGNWWTDFWNWLSNAVEQVLTFVQKVVTAIGDAVMVGINMIVQGIEQVFHCKIQFLEDIAAAIGSFFNMLEKVLSDVLEALSILFQFGEIIKTQQMLKSFLVDQLLNLENTINTNVIPHVQDRFQQEASKIKSAFDTAISSVPSAPVSQQGAIASQSQTQGGFATPHTIATFKAQDGSSSSQAVQSNYGTQKMKSGMPSATIANTYAQALGDDNPFVDFLTGFVTDVETSIIDNFENLQSKFSANFSSVSSFFDSILKDFLLILEELILDGFDIARDLVVGDPNNSSTQGGLLGLIGKLIPYLIGTDGILNKRIEIPVITWLFELIFQEDLSFLNLITFVVAIPVTVLFKIISGKYPSETSLPTTSSTATVDAVGSPLGELWNSDARIYCGVAYAFLSLLGGIVAVVSDALDNQDATAIASIVCVTSLLCIPLSLPYFTTGSPKITDWVEFGLTVGGYLAGMGFAVWSLYTELDSEAAGKSSSGAIAVYSLISLMIFCIIFQDNDPHPGVWDNVSFAAALLAWINGMVNPLKFIPEVKPVILFFDLALPLTSGIMTCVDYIAANLPITAANYVTANTGYSVVLLQGGSVIATLPNPEGSAPSTTPVSIDPTLQLVCQQQSTSDPTSTIPICSVDANKLSINSYVKFGNKPGEENAQCDFS